MASDIKLTQEQKDLLFKYRNNRNRAWVAKTCGVSPTTVYLYTKRFNGNIGKRGDMPKPILYPRLTEIVKEKYLTTPVVDIAREVGCSNALVRQRAAQLGIVRSKEQKENIRKIQYERAGVMFRKPEIREKAVTRLRRLRKMEEMRINSGLEPTRNWRHKTITRKASYAKWYLRKYYGYAYCEEDPYALLITNETRRCEREDYFEGKYGVKFYEV